jgi:Fic family protein
MNKTKKADQEETNQEETHQESERQQKPASGGRRTESRQKLTISDIARMAGVSKKTVSRVINHSGQVRQDTRDKILSVVKEHGYQPDPRARRQALFSRRTARPWHAPCKLGMAEAPANRRLPFAA